MNMPQPRLVAAGTKTYRYANEFPEISAELTAVPESLRTVTRAFTGLGYRSASAAYLVNPSVARLKDMVRSAAVESDILVIYYTGHGIRPERRPYYMLTAGSRLSRLDETAVQVRQLADLVLRMDVHGEMEVEQPQVLLILDCCFSGAGGIEAISAVSQGLGNPNVWVLASAGSLEYAEQGLFAVALEKALQDPDVGKSQRLLGLDWLTSKINDALEGAGQRARYFPPPGGITGLAPFFPNPIHQPGVAGMTVDEQHWLTKIRGTPVHGPLTGHYLAGRQGRRRVVEHIAAWLSRPAADLAVVTGSPGAGKSTILSLPVLLSDPGQLGLRADRTADGLLGHAAELFADLPVIGVHARGMNTDQAAQAIGQRLGLSVVSATQLLEDLDQRGTIDSATIVVDAVDEARAPNLLLAALLEPLSRRRELRVLIGARRHILTETLIADLVLDLDADEYRDPQALADYVNDLLIGAHEPELDTPYRHRPELAQTVATALAGKATGTAAPSGRSESFLLAQLLSRALRNRPDVIDTSNPGWTDDLPGEVGDAFAEDLARLAGREPIARALLTALAWARGPGLPWEQIWLPMAQAIAAIDTPTPPVLSEADIRWLQHKAGAYIVEDLGAEGRSVYRPFHDLLAAYLRFDSTPLVERKGDSQRTRRIEQAITDALLATVPVDTAGQPDWRVAHPYVLTYLAQHAQAAGPQVVAELIADPGYLVHANPDTLAPAIRTSTTEQSRQTRNIYVASAGRHRIATPDVRRQLLAVDAARYGHRKLAGQLTAAGDLPIVWATGSQVNDALRATLTGHNGRINAVACTALNGIPVAVTGGHDGTVRVWDLANGAERCVLTGHGGSVHAVACTVVDGVPVAVTGGSEGTVRIWDLANGTERCVLTGHGWSVHAVACTVVEGVPVAVTGAGDGTVRVWDLATGTKRCLGTNRGVLISQYGSVHALACAVVDGVPVAITGWGDGTVHVSELGTGTKRRVWDKDGVLASRYGSVHAVASTVVDDSPIAITGWSDRTVRISDLSTGTERAILAAHGGFGEVSSLACVELDDTVVVVGGERNGLVRVWDLYSGSERIIRTGHDGAVTAVASTVLDDTVVAVTGGQDGTLRVWDLTSTDAHAGLTGRFSGRISGMACTVLDGTPVAVGGGSDGTVRVWNLATGAERRAMVGHDGSVYAVGCTVVDDVPVAVTGGDDGTVRVWDLTRSAERYALAGHDGPIDVVACMVLDGEPVAVTGGEDGTVRVWNLAATGAERWALAGHALTSPHGRTPGAYAAACTALDNTMVAVTGGIDGVVRVWNLATGAERRALVGHDGSVYAVACTVVDDVPVAVTGGDDGTVRVWDLTTGAERRAMVGHDGSVYAVGCTVVDDVPVAVTGGEDGTVRVWNLTAGTERTRQHLPYSSQALATAPGLIIVAFGNEVISFTDSPIISLPRI